MYVAVVEECALWELPRGATDLLPDGPVTHGPWEPRRCAELITRWLDHGWIELYLPDIPAGWNVPSATWQGRAAQRNAFLTLATEDARQLLQDPKRWTVETADGQVCLSRSDAGMTIDPRDWVNAAAESETS